MGRLALVFLSLAAATSLVGAFDGVARGSPPRRAAVASCTDVHPAARGVDDFGRRAELTRVTVTFDSHKIVAKFTTHGKPPSGLSEIPAGDGYNFSVVFAPARGAANGTELDAQTTSRADPFWHYQVQSTHSADYGPAGPFRGLSGSVAVKRNGATVTWSAPGGSIPKTGRWGAFILTVSAKHAPDGHAVAYGGTSRDVCPSSLAMQLNEPLRGGLKYG